MRFIRACIHPYIIEIFKFIRISAVLAINKVCGYKRDCKEILIMVQHDILRITIFFLKLMNVIFLIEYSYFCKVNIRHKVVFLFFLFFYPDYAIYSSKKVSVVYFVLKICIITKFCYI